MNTAAAWRTLPVVALAGLCWAGLLWMAFDMGGWPARLAMPLGSDWSAANLLWVAAMWLVMMAAMMLPSALPMLAAFRRMEAGQAPSGRPRWFLAGYLIVWAGFGLAATGLQWLLQHLALVDPMGESRAAWLDASLLVVAGAVQFTPLKRTCLKHCRSPLGFLMAAWRPGRDGALRMGLRHGALCLGCCGALMLLLFVGGVMNVAWVAALALLVAAEKLLPGGERLSLVLGVALILLGAVALVA